MNATVWSLYPQRERLPFRFKRLLQGFIWLLVASFVIGMLSIVLAAAFYVPMGVRAADNMVAGLKQLKH